MKRWSEAVGPGDVLHTEAKNSPLTVLAVSVEGVRIEATGRTGKPTVLLSYPLLDSLWRHRREVRRLITGGERLLAAIGIAWTKDDLDIDHKNESQYWAVVLARDGRAGPKATDGEQRWVEGERVLLSISRVERSRELRRACVEKFGARCSVCDLSFEERYPGIGDGFIHVHHLKPVATRGLARIAPEELRPVCPNCHAMLHQRVPPLSIDELKSILQECE